MVKIVEFVFDFGSPNAYLAYKVLPEMLARTGAEQKLLPCLLGGIFKATGNSSPIIAYAGVPAKLKYQMVEIRRFIAKHKLTKFKMNPHFPVNTLGLMRGAIAAEREGCFSHYVDVIFHNMWSEPRKLDDPAVVRAVLEENDFDAQRLLAGAQAPEIKAALIANTDAAVARGAFGSPTFFVGAEMFFGKDQLRDVEEAILGGERTFTPT